jgi:hypothetical protein
MIILESLDWNIVIGAIISGTIAVLGTMYGVNKHIDYQREIDRLEMEAEKEKKEFERYKSRPKFEINKVELRGKSPDVELFNAPIEIYGKYNGVYWCLYDDRIMEKENHSYIDYEIKNIGENDALYSYIAVNNKKGSCLFEYKDLEMMFNDSLMNYSYSYDRAIKSQEKLVVRIYSHDEMTPVTFMSALLSVACEDEYENKWVQAFFYPDDNLYNSRKQPSDQFKSLISDDDMFNRMDDPHRNPLEGLEYSHRSEGLKARVDLKVDKRNEKYIKD